MGLSLLESIRKLIRQDTVKVGGAVGNMHGAVPASLGDDSLIPGQTWLVLNIPGRGLPTLSEFFDAFSENPTAIRLELADEGVLQVTSRPNTVALLRTVVDAERTLSFNMEVAVPSTGAVAAVYVDGTLVRTVRGDVAVPISLSAGRHVLYVVASSPSVRVVVPRRIGLSGEADVPRAPQWASLTTGYLDELAGTAANVLRWVSDSEVSSYRVLRREPVLIGDLLEEGDGEVLEASEITTNETYQITLQGDHFDKLEKNAVLLLGGSSIGIVVGVTVLEGDPDQTLITCRLPLGVDEPPLGLVGQLLSVGTFNEIARVTRVANTSVIEYKDAAVTTGRAYEYALQATGLVDESILSPLSEVRYIVTGDITPPGPIVIQDDYPQVFNRTVSVKFLAPPDLDYVGVNVYYRKQVLNPLPVGFEPYFLETINGDQVVSDNEEFPTDPEDNLSGYLLEFMVSDLERYTFQIVSNTASTLTLSDPVPQEVLEILNNETDPIGLNIFQDIQLKTHFGRPNRIDELSFVSDEYGLLWFATFDRSGNEQQFVDGVSWEYTPQADRSFKQPILALRQLLPEEQEFFATPTDYTDTTRFAIIEIWAYDPTLPEGSQFEGIKLFYQRVGLDPEPIELFPVPLQNVDFPNLVTSSLQAVLDDPQGVRSRFVLIDREYEQIRVWAKNAQGFTTDQMTYVVDLDDTPEVTVEVYYNFFNETVTFIAVADDDCQGITWEIKDLANGIIDSRTRKRFTVGPFPLVLGERRILTVTPFGSYDPGPPPTVEEPGEAVVRELFRTPRSYVTFDSKDFQGNRSATFVTASFSMVPPPVRVFPAPGVQRSGVVSQGAGGFVLTDSGAGWTPGQFQAGTTQFFYLILRPSGGLPPIIRRIASNDASTLTVNSGLGQYVGIGSVPYEIVDGAVLFREVPDGNQPSEFIPTLGRETFPRVEEFELEFFATKNNSYPESVRRVFVDEDDVPRLIGFGYTVVTEGQVEFLQVGFDAPDDDATTWEAYERKNAWPTVSGNPPSTTNVTPQTELDRNFLRFAGSVDQTFYKRATSGMTPGDVWYAVAVPRNSFGQAGIASAATHTVGGALSKALTALNLTPQVGLSTVNAAYTANSAAAPNDNVSFTSFRTDRPNVVVSATRQVSQSPYVLDVGETIVASGGNPRTWRVTASLAGGNSLTREINFRVSGPSIAGLTLSASTAVFDIGSCDASNGCIAVTSRPHSRQVSWVLQQNGQPLPANSPYFINIKVSNATSPGPNDYVPVVYAVPAAENFYIHESLCKYQDPQGLAPTKRWTYWVEVADSNGNPLGLDAVTNQVQDSIKECSSVTGPGSGTGGGGGGPGDGQIIPELE